MAAVKNLKAPFPYPGGKSRVAGMVWDRLGDPDNYVEPFMGTLAVLLRRPACHFAGGYRVETVNDVNHYLVNFWRAVRADPEKVAEFADWPVAEADLHARHKWLVRSAEAAEFRERMAADPDHFDAKVAGWWVWGACCWIGGAWCSDAGLSDRRPSFSFNNLGPGVRRNAEVPADWQQTPDLTADSQRGVHGRPQLADAYDVGRGVNGGGHLDKQRPLLAHGQTAGGPSAQGVIANLAAGTCDARRAWLVAWMRALSDRLRLVRTLYGHWSRPCDSPSTLTRLGTVGVFLDPPYPARRADTGAKSRDDNLYASDKLQCLDGLRDEVLAWCRKWGGDPLIRVALCCYEADGYEPLEAEGWSVESWSASGGYANQRRGGKGKAANADRERIYFSPACLRKPTLFDGLDGT